MQIISNAALSLAVLASFALVGGAIYLLVKKHNVKQGLLMLLAAAVLLGNVAVWTVPI
jgi:hypothetical protein